MHLYIQPLLRYVVSDEGCSFLYYVLVKPWDTLQLETGFRYPGLIVFCMLLGVLWWQNIETKVWELTEECQMIANAFVNANTASLVGALMRGGPRIR